MANQCVDTFSQKKTQEEVQGISLLSLPEKVYAKCCEKRCRKIVEPQLQDVQFGFRPGRSIMNEIFAL